MGKSFNDDIFNGFNVDSINGLSISQEAINENKKVSDKPKLDININLDEAKKEFSKQEKTKPKKDDTETIQENIKRDQELRDIEQQAIKQVISNNITTEQPKVIYTKKTMIFKQDYLDIIDGLASINDMQVKDVLNQLLEKSINELDDTIREKALKTGRKPKQKHKTDKSIF